MCSCTRKERNDEWRAGKGLPFGLPGLGAVCGVARACKVPTLLRAGALHPAPRPGNAIPENWVNRPQGHCDGGSIGSGTMEVCCFVVDFETARRVIAEDLAGSKKFGDYTRIFDEDAE